MYLTTDTPFKVCADVERELNKRRAGDESFSSSWHVSICQCRRRSTRRKVWGGRFSCGNWLDQSLANRMRKTEVTFRTWKPELQGRDETSIFMFPFICTPFCDSNKIDGWGFFFWDYCVYTCKSKIQFCFALGYKNSPKIILRRKKNKEVMSLLVVTVVKILVGN